MGDGGAIFTQDEALYKKIKMIANHGQSIQYLHDAVGVNSRLDSLQAAILRVKLNHLDTYTKARQQAANTYDIAFANQAHITIPARAPWSTHVFHQYTLKLSGVNRDQVRKLLADKEIPSMVYYPIPLHLQKAYQSDRFPAGKFPVTEHLCANVLSLPMNTELDEDQLAYICTNLLKICTLN